MGLPAPEQFDAQDRSAFRASMLAALGPLLTFGVLIVSYALSARVCQAWARPVIWAAIALAAAGSGAALQQLRRERAGLSFSLRLAAIGLQAFCLCVLVAFAIASTTAVHCE
jgi:hypothetical protein